MLIKADKYSVEMLAQDLTDIFDMAFDKGACKWASNAIITPSNGILGEAEVETTLGMRVLITAADLCLAVEQLLNDANWAKEDFAWGFHNMGNDEIDTIVQIAAFGAVVY